MQFDAVYVKCEGGFGLTIHVLVRINANAPRELDQRSLGEELGYAGINPIRAVKIGCNFFNFFPVVCLLAIVNSYIEIDNLFVAFKGVNFCIPR